MSFRNCLGLIRRPQIVLTGEKYRIGVFDLIRIAWRSKIDSPDVTYSYAVLFMFTLLEPELGTFLACLPLCQPVAHSFVKSSYFLWSRNTLFGTIKWSRSGTNNTSKRSVGSVVSNNKMRHANQEEFRRLPGDSESSKGLRYEEHGLADLEAGDDGMRTNMARDAIRVKQTWRVDSQERAHR